MSQHVLEFSTRPLICFTPTIWRRPLDTLWTVGAWRASPKTLERCQCRTERHTLSIKRRCAWPVPLSKRLTLCERKDENRFQNLRRKLKGTCVYLVGMMGSGKSTVGASLASALGYTFIDTDVIVEQTLQRSISEIFAEEGEAYFREVESLVMDSLQSHLRKVIATGGGVVLRQRNWGVLQTGLVVYLRATPELLAQRVEHGTGRPLLSQGTSTSVTDMDGVAQREALRERLERLVTEREHLYHQADVTVELQADASIAQVVDMIADALVQFIDEHPSASSRYRAQQS